MQTNTPFRSHEMATQMPMSGMTSQSPFSADRSWVQEDRAQSLMILRACAIWVVAILGAVVLTLIMAGGAFAASPEQLSVSSGSMAAKAIVSLALLAAASLTIYMLRDTAQRVPVRKRRRSDRPG
jgi:hypothetical protein